MMTISFLLQHGLVRQILRRVYSRPSNRSQPRNSTVRTTRCLDLISLVALSPRPPAVQPAFRLRLPARRECRDQT